MEQRCGSATDVHGVKVERLEEEPKDPSSAEPLISSDLRSMHTKYKNLYAFFLHVFIFYSDHVRFSAFSHP